MKEKILTFEEVLEQTKDYKQRSVLLGNGFSIGYDNNRFSYTSLFDSAVKKDLILKDSELYRVFEKLGTKDFEKVIRHLDEAKLLSDIYFNNFNIDKLNLDILNLKEYLICTIMNNHPECVSDFDIIKSRNCSNFLKNFTKIFTLNYDLLLYWTILQNRMEEKFTDGFADDESKDYLDYTRLHGNSFFFLHGALHLFDNKTTIKKLCFKRTSINLKKQIEYNLSRDIYPVFVSEGTSDDKLEKIIHNTYLSSCYNSFKTSSGALVIYGTTLKTNDEHIIKAIALGNFDKIFIGANNNVQSAFDLKEKIMAQSIEIVNKIKAKKENTKKEFKEVFIYDSKTANVWE